MQDNRETDADEGLGGFEELAPISAVSDLSDLPEPEWSPTKTLMGHGGRTTTEPFESPPFESPPFESQPYQAYEHQAYEREPSSQPAAVEPEASYGQSAASVAVAHFDLDGPDDPHDGEVTLQVDGAAVEAAEIPGDLPVNWDVNEDVATSHYAGAQSQAFQYEEMDVGHGSIAPAGNPSPFPSQVSAPEAPYRPVGPANTAPLYPAITAPPVPSVPPPPISATEPALATTQPPHQSVGQVAAPYTAALPATLSAPTLPAPTLPPPPPPSAGPVSLDFEMEQERRRRGGFMGSRIALLLAVLLLCGVSLWAAYALMGVQTGSVQVATTPADAELQLDGKVLAIGDESPFVLTLAAGEPHQLVISKPGFVPHTMTLDVAAGETKVLERVALDSVAPAETGFAIDSTPAGAEILVDGEPTGQVTPARVTGISAGKHSVALVPPAGYSRLELGISVATGAVTEVPAVSLVAAPEVVAADGEAADGEAADGETADGEAAEDAAGDTPDGSSKLVAKAEAQYERRIARKTASIKARARSERRAAAAADRRARQNSRVREPVVRMKPVDSQAASGMGTLRVNSRPWAEVTLNGRSIGTTPILNKQGPAGTHTLTLHNPSMDLSKTIKVRVPKGKTVTKRVTLIP